MSRRVPSGTRRKANLGTNEEARGDDDGDQRLDFSIRIILVRFLTESKEVPSR